MRTALNKLIGEESGQAAIEYILLLVVVVGVLLGSVYQFNSAFSFWADNYFGDYLACLIESGELPSLGGSSGSSGECNQLYKEFSPDDGRPLIASNSGGGGTDSITKDPPSNDNTTSSSGGGSAVIVSGGGGRDSSFGRRGAPRRFRMNSNLGDDGANKKDGSNTGSAGVTDLSGYEKGKAVRIPLREYDPIARGRRIKEDEKDKKVNTKVAAPKDGAVRPAGPIRIRIDRNIAASSTGPEIEELTFGKLFRYLIIIAIILAVIIFIGGQALQVSKSMD